MNIAQVSTGIPQGSVLGPLILTFNYSILPAFKIYLILMIHRSMLSINVVKMRLMFMVIKLIFEFQKNVRLMIFDSSLTFQPHVQNVVKTLFIQFSWYSGTKVFALFRYLSHTWLIHTVVHNKQQQEKVYLKQVYAKQHYNKKCNRSNTFRVCALCNPGQSHELSEKRNIKNA